MCLFCFISPNPSYLVTEKIKTAHLYLPPQSQKKSGGKGQWSEHISKLNRGKQSALPQFKTKDQSSSVVCKKDDLCGGTPHYIYTTWARPGQGLGGTRTVCAYSSNHRVLERCKRKRKQNNKVKKRANQNQKKPS